MYDFCNSINKIITITFLKVSERIVNTPYKLLFTVNIVGAFVIAFFIKEPMDNRDG
jgi:fluoride ion exporter CrcB/FEX